MEETIDRLAEMLQEQLVPQLKNFVQAAAGMNPMALSPQLETLLQPLNARGTVNNSAQIADNIAASYSMQLTQYHLLQVAQIHRRLRRLPGIGPHAAQASAGKRPQGP